MGRLVMYSGGVHIGDIRDVPWLQAGSFAVALADGQDAKVEVHGLDRLSNEVR